MGQSPSSTPEQSYAHDLASSFQDFFKNYKIESKILSSETITSIQSLLEKGDVQKTISVICDALKEIENAPINIAVTGESGSGKSSFINALRGVDHEGKDAAQVGYVETTMERRDYKHPKISNVTIWDLPGIGTTRFPPWKYLKEMKFGEYDFFIIISTTRFKENDAQLAKAIKKMNKNFYFVRSKVDSDIYNEKKSKPKTFNKDTLFQDIRKDCLEHLEEAEVTDPCVFLISSFDVSDYDFPKLQTTLLKDLPAQKRHIFVQCLPCVTEAAIDRKRDSLKQKIWLEALKAGAWATIPFMSVEGDEMQTLKETLNLYRSHFGLDDESLKNMAESLNVSLEELTENIKSPNLLSGQKDEETLGKTLLKCVEKIFSVSGGLIATGLYFGKMFYWQTYFLDTVVDDAKVLLKKEEIFRIDATSEKTKPLLDAECENGKSEAALP
ncbi:T-cell-specific guanine nucleotide triphosphate-binding protein 2-like isoform X2 [Choloepus didactylus]|uniref:T-cell-specific guanine nucleotide triphosphate-binding protein 2-like isoform X2 n=1 Tax=Choloepus didactylus TaxID=27675 RepID=UPI00189FEBCA|nr:T-cell-specific guanine nucleotide triphosphate-binding protein 2-like isoform X2 [Choloepus didactylus]